MPITIEIGGRGGRSQFIEWSGPPGTDPSLGSFARNPKNPVPLPVKHNRQLHFESSDPLIATVDHEGKVTAVAPGNCFITCTDEENGMRATDRLTVVQKPREVAPTLTLINN